MDSQVKSALLVTFLMLSSGCIGLLDTDIDPQIPVIDCSLEPSHPDCFEKIITEEDCKINEVFMGESCRLMLRPEKLNYGENFIQISIGEEMQPLTPSFIGDGPELWQVSPPLPQGLNLDEKSGMIYGLPNKTLTPTIFTIKGSNEAGFSNTILQIEILPLELGKLEYSSEIMNCIISLFCNLSQPSINGIPDSWSIEPPLPHGLTLNQNGSIDGIITTQLDSNHSIYASNLVGTSEAKIRIISLYSAPFGLNYEFHNYSLTKYNSVEIEPSISGGTIQSWTITPELPRGLRFNSDGKIEGKPMVIQEFTKYTITASNSGGSLSTEILIEIKDIIVENIQYPNYYFNLTKNKDIGTIEPNWDGGDPLSWDISPLLPDGLYFNSETGNISGVPIIEQNWLTYDIWANNTGGSSSTQIVIKIIQ